MELKSDYQKNIYTDRYQKDEETLDDTFHRVAKFASTSEAKPFGWGKRKQETQFYELLSSGLHVPGGRVLANAGGNNMIYNCFVIDIEDSRAGIIKTLGDFTEIASKGGGIGINFSPIRPRGAYVKGSEAVASGPCSFIDMFQAAAETIKQGGCLSGDTLVSTNRGLIKIKDIVEKKLPVKVWTEDGWKAIVHYWDNGEKPISKITTESGRVIRCTKEHKFETISKKLSKSQIYEMKSISSGLAKDDYLISLIPDNHESLDIPLEGFKYKKSKHASTLNEDVRLPEFLTKKLAYLIGLVFADGYVHQNKAIKIAVSPDQKYIEENITSIVDNLFGLSVSRNQGDGCINVIFYSRILIEWLRKNELLKTEKALNIKVPEKIFVADKEIKLAFLAGFFDGDGCNGGSKSGLMFSTISEQFAKEISLLLLSCGLLSRTYKNIRSGNRHDLHTVTVVCDDFKSLQREFSEFSKKASRHTGSNTTTRHAFPFNVFHEGLVSNRLARQYGLTQNKCYQQTARNFINKVPPGESEVVDAMRDRYPDKIISIEPCEREHVYDLEVEGTHKYLANGLYLSNSRGLAAMAVLNCDHPDILEFVEKKSGGEDVWNNFNVSVGITDMFMDAVKTDANWELQFKGTIHKTIRARKLWETICSSAWASGEPGVLFLDTINKRNPISYVGDIQATNPCVVKGSLVPTPDGYKKVEDISEGDAILTTRGIENVDTIEKHNDIPVFKVSLSDGGEITATAAHIFHAFKKGSQSKKREEIRLDKLEIGDSIRVHPCFLERRDGNLYKNKDFANGLMKGILLGDGCYTKKMLKHKVIKICMNDQEEKFMDNIEKLFRLNGGSFNKTDYGYEGHACSLMLRDGLGWVKKLKLTPAYSYEKDFDIAGKTYSELLGILAGLFVTDGNINLSSNHPMVRFSTTSRKMAQNIRRAGLILGMHPRINTSFCKSGKINGRQIIRRHTKYDVHFSGQSLQIFKDAMLEWGIHDFHPEKGEKLLDLDNWILSGNTHKAQVIGIEEAGSNDVYDLYCPASDAWIVDGYVQRGCGEQPLLPYSACNLGSLNLPAFIEDGEMNWGLLQETIRTAIAFHDNLIDQSIYPLERIKERVMEIRPIGLGVMGLADWLFLQGLAYGEESKEAVKMLFKTISDHAMAASRELAEELGTFPAFDPKHDDNPRRNSTLISFAPTGSIASMYDVSHGIEPHFALMTYKNEELGKHIVGVPVIEKWMTDNNTKEVPHWARFVLNAPEDQDLEVKDHLAILSVASEASDSGVSKTVNLPEDADVDDIEDVFMGAWEGGIIKGCTIYRDGSRDVQALSATDFEDEISHGELASLVVATARPVILSGKTYRIKPKPGGEWLYITINDFEDVPMEIFFASRDATHQEYLGVLGDVLTTLFRRGEPAIHIVKDLLKHQGNSGGGWYEGQYIPSTAAAIGMIMKKHYQSLDLMPSDVVEKKDTNGSNMLRCPSCGEFRIVVQEGCKNCLACGYSKCG